MSHPVNCEIHFIVGSPVDIDVQHSGQIFNVWTVITYSLLMPVPNHISSPFENKIRYATLREEFHDTEATDDTLNGKTISKLETLMKGIIYIKLYKHVTDSKFLLK